MKPSITLLPLSIAVLGYASLAQRPKTEAISYGRDVRPILSQHCFKCHGPDSGSLAAGLRLDTFAGATASVIVPGKPEKSRLMDRVSDSHAERRMPPMGSGVSALTKEQIRTLRAWIAEGAKYEKHWAFVPPQMPTIPKVSDPKWVRNPLDAFVLAKLDQANLKPEPEADRNTLALRAAQTLTGLPPSPMDLKVFRKDTKPGAYERYVDRLLAKPSYGEHQARYWLDAVRYADTHGLQLDNERSVYPYRDWVVRAFNQDLPYSQFVKWQLAGDLVPNPTNEQLVATGYVRMNLTSNEGGAIAEEFLARNTFDRVDTTSTTLLGLTVACAKCHDHKYDPIKQKEYYSLYAYFNSTKDDPLDGNIALPPPFISASTPEQEGKMKTILAKLNRLRSGVDADTARGWFAEHREPVPDSRDWQVSPVVSFPSFDEAFDQPAPGEPGQPDPAWKTLALELGKDLPGLVGQDNAAVYVRGTLKFPAAQKVTFSVGSDDAIKVWLNGTLIHANKTSRGLSQGNDPVKGEFRAGDNELVCKVVNGTSVDGLRVSFGPFADPSVTKALADYNKSPKEGAGALINAFLMNGPESPSALSFRQLFKEREDLEATFPKSLIAEEMETPRQTFVLKRGQYDQPGPEVHRQLPAILGRIPKGSPNNRLGLAEWITSPANPLTARVFVNRVWQQHFGVGIVRTAEDFGLQGEWPVNQPLLDYLAVAFVKNGMSVKKLNRMIVTSAAFRQASKIPQVKLERDPQNRLITRGPRFRLDAEMIRDKALFASGLLLDQTGGHGFKPYQPDGLWEGSSDPASSTHFYVRDKGAELYRRSLYLFWKRTSPPPVMITFDSPTRDTCIVRRSATNTPLQALTLLNETSFLEASRIMAARILAIPGSDQQRIARLFDLAFSRAPRTNETALIAKALVRYRQTYKISPDAVTKLLSVGDAPMPANASPIEQVAWMIVCSSVMNTDEFVTQH